MGGALLPFGWRLLFAINVPFAFILSLTALKRLPNERRGTLHQFDWIGMIFLVPGLFATALAITQVNARAVVPSLLLPSVAALFVAGILLLILFFVRERRAQSPLIRMDTFRSRGLIIAMVLAFGAGVTEATFVYLPPFLVNAFAISSSHASYLLSIPVIALAVGAPVSGRMLDKFGARGVLLAGTSLLSAGLFIFALVPPSHTQYVVADLLLGCGIASLVGAPVRYLVLSEARPDEKASLQSAISLFTNAGQLLGIVLVGAMAASHATGVSGYQTAFGTVATLSLLLCIAAFSLHRKRQFSTQGETV